MIEYIIIWTIIVICALFIGRRFFRQWKAAFSQKGTLSSCDGCTCCTDTSCDSRKD